MKMTFTSPGKLGDCLMQWPLAFWWHRETGQPFDFWMDEKTCKPLVKLIQAQPGVADVKLQPGIQGYAVGGQPWHFGFDGTEHQDRQITHLGLRAFPQRQLTLQCREDIALTLNVNQQDLAETPSLVVPELPKAKRLVLHGMGICPHTKQTPGFWKFVAKQRHEFERRYDEIVFVGTPSDREIGLTTYPNWKEFDDHGDFLELGSYMKASEMVIGCGSSPIVLAGCLKVPAIRVHDDIGNAPKVIWSNLGSNQINETEFGLRQAYADFLQAVTA